MTCGKCGAPLARAGVRFCTSCGAPVEAAPGGQATGQGQGGSQGWAPPGQARQPQYGQPQSGHGQYGQPQYGAPPYAPQGQPRASSSPIKAVLIGAVLVLVVLGGIAYWALTQMDNPPISIGRATTPTATPAPTVAPTATRAPGLGINIPGPQGTPTTISIPLPIPGLGATPGEGGGLPGLPNLPIPGLNGTPGADGAPAISIPGLGASPAIPGASGTAPPNAKLTADQAREKVKETLSTCQLLQTQVALSQVTFEPPNWRVRLPLSGATWTVDDNTGAVTADERAADRAKNCRL